MRAVMESEAWQKGHAAIPIVLGKDVAGNPVMLDLAKAPHLLIAGSTGSGKSVCMNTLIMSLLFKFPPDELRLIMVDPKIVEFEDYKKLPHLITPVINDSKKVPIALRWAVTEMEKRYHILAKAGVKKLAEYNSRRDPEPVYDENGVAAPEKMPVLIVIIDELAELMMTDARKDSEAYITRIAQLGRAAGVHIVVATQRPSTQIITGVIKANLPTRIAFRVGQMVDSRVILDQNGAEKLLGSRRYAVPRPGRHGSRARAGRLGQGRGHQAGRQIRFGPGSAELQCAGRGRRGGDGGGDRRQCGRLRRGRLHRYRAGSSRSTCVPETTTTCAARSKWSCADPQGEHPAICSGG